ncbi:MAG: hypothetical protein IJY39_00395, partial [Clostridia bacterium]|nr:hypothetical protein [Clostridia bacterium]
REFWEANRISLQGNALKYHFCDSKNITLSKTAYHKKLSGNAHLLTTKSGGIIEKADTEPNPYRLFDCPLEPEAIPRRFFDH